MDVVDDGRTISDAGFGMFQARGRETEHTSQWQLGVGHPKTSARSSRENAEAEIIFPSLSARARRSPRRGSGCSKVLLQANPALVAPIPAGSRAGILPSGTSDRERSPAESRQPSRSPRRTDYMPAYSLAFMPTPTSVPLSVGEGVSLH